MSVCSISRHGVYFRVRCFRRSYLQFECPGYFTSKVVYKEVRAVWLILSCILSGRVVSLLRLYAKVQKQCVYFKSGGLVSRVVPSENGLRKSRHICSLCVLHPEFPCNFVVNAKCFQNTDESCTWYRISPELKYSFSPEIASKR